ncbi:MAG: potassium-transporting ATPase subunit KdpA [Myxococcales bacterium]|nr:potassium-transporting ATPase subunit KdpA [Myxococcales bacterium]
MTGATIVGLVAFAACLSLLAWPLGGYLARVFDGTTRATRVLGPVERLIYRVGGVDRDEDMPWPRYATAVVVFNLAGVVVVYLLQRLQGSLPGNPNDLHAVPSPVAWNTAISFVSNTNWQAYSGEATMSHLVAALALTVQNFVSAATGIAVLVALVRGFSRAEARGVGNFWVDLTRATLYVLVPMAIVMALILVWQGVPQTGAGHLDVAALDGGGHGQITVGPVASQVAIKQLGTNGGGYFGVNSAHPLENPTPLTNFVQCLAILLIPAALCLAFGRMVQRRRQGVAFLVTMWLLFVPFAAVTIHQELSATPAIAAVDDAGAVAIDVSAGNMEGKEQRFTAAEAALWASATTAASNGSVNSMHDSYQPLAGAATIALMGLGEVAFGGVGSGLYGLILFAIIAVFLSGLMIGRTPEFMGKKVEAHEMKLASIGVLVPAVALLIGTALACSTSQATTLGNGGAHGFTEMLYAMTSAANNNGSAFGGLTASGPFWATTQGILMWLGRFGALLPVLALAGALARKKRVPVTSGTLPTDSSLFVAFLVATVLLVGALTLVPALALGPIAEHLAR